MPPSADTLRRILAIAGSTLALAACGGDEETVSGSDGGVAESAPQAVVEPAFVAPTGCPTVRVLEALYRVSRYRPGSTAAADLIARGAMGPPDGGCEYDFDEATVEIEMLLPVQVELGPAWTPGQSVDLPYYVWVIDSRREPPGDIILRQGFPAPFELDDDEPFELFREELVLTIPLPDGPQSGRAYQVLIGFQMPRAEAGRPF